MAFTADPSTSAVDRVVIEAAFGHGEVVVSGRVEPDTYVVAKENLSVLDARIGRKTFKIVRGPDGHDRTVELDQDAAESRVLDDSALRRIASLAIATERHNGGPRDVEWAISAGKTWLVQARPITTHGSVATADTDQTTVLARGLPAAPGVASGMVRVLLTPDLGDRLVDGEILVAPMTNPDWLHTIRRAAAIVTDSGGMTCHAAIVAREVGVPCIGARTATSDLRDGTMVMVDGTHGKVHVGRPAVTSQASSIDRPVAATGAVEVTGTKIYVNLAMADSAERVRQMMSMGSACCVPSSC